MASGSEEKAESYLSSKNSEHIINTWGHLKHLTVHCNWKPFSCFVTGKCQQGTWGVAWILIPPCQSFSSTHCTSSFGWCEREKKQKCCSLLTGLWTFFLFQIPVCCKIAGCFWFACYSEKIITHYIWHNKVPLVTYSREDLIDMSSYINHRDVVQKGWIVN